MPLLASFINVLGDRLATALNQGVLNDPVEPDVPPTP